MKAKDSTSAMEKKLCTDKSPFQSYLLKVKSAADWSKYESLNTTEDKFEFLQSLPGVNDLEPEVTDSMKNLEKAMALKDEGNKIFKTQQFIEARDVYTKSLQHYPVDQNDFAKNKDYSIILANRSAALEHLKMYAACVQDCDLALKYGYPKELQFKVYNRKAIALNKRKQYVGAKASFKKCSDMLGKSSLPTAERDKWRKRLAKHMNVFTVVKTLYNAELAPRPNIPLDGGPHPEHPNMSAKLKFDNSKAVADQDIGYEKGLLKEEAFAAIISDPDAERRICPHTMRRMGAPVPCSFGSDTMFFDEAAREEADGSYQRFEWALAAGIKKMGLSATARLALRMVTSLQPNETEIVLGAASGEEINVEGKVKSACELFKMAAEDKPTAEQSFDAMVVAWFLLRCLRKTEYIAKPGNDKNLTGDEQRVLALLHKAVLIACSYGVYINFGLPPQQDKPDSMQVKEYAIAVFPTLARLQHYSKPNEESDVMLQFQDKTVNVLSLKALKPGMSLNVVIDSKGNRSKCELLNDLVSFRCSGANCSLSFPLKEKTKETVIRCPMESCGAETNIWQRQRRIVELRKDHAVAKDDIAKGKYAEAIVLIIHIIQEWEKIVFRPNKDISELESDMQKAMFMDFVKKETEWFQETK